MKAKIFSTLLVLLTLAAPSAFGISTIDYLVEPYLGYGLLGASNVAAGSYASTSSNYASYNGVALGARAGIDLLGMIFVAADGSYYPSISSSLNSPGNSFNLVEGAPLFVSGASNSKLGLSLGATVPIVGLRVWLGYNLLDQLRGTSGTTLTGFSYKLGLGYQFLPFISGNLELINAQYSQYTNGAGSTLNNPAGTVTNRHLLLSVSAPFVL